MSFSPTITRKIEFDSAHRVMNHESKCRNLHGHRYVAEITVRASSGDLDQLGRVIDFSVLKSEIGAWVDEHWDHGCIVHRHDLDLIQLCKTNNWKCFLLWDNPTAENMASYLLEKCADLMYPHGIEVMCIRLYETPNCWAEVVNKL